MPQRKVQHLCYHEGCNQPVVERHRQCHQHLHYCACGATKKTYLARCRACNEDEEIKRVIREKYEEKNRYKQFYAAHRPIQLQHIASPDRFVRLANELLKEYHG